MYMPKEVDLAKLLLRHFAWRIIANSSIVNMLRFAQERSLANLEPCAFQAQVSENILSQSPSHPVTLYSKVVHMPVLSGSS